MKPIFTTLLALALSFCFQQSKAQDKPVHPTLIRNGVFLGETPPLRDLPALTFSQIKKLARKKQHEENELNEKLEHRSYPFAETALPKGPDAVWQKSMGDKSVLSNSPIQNFAGQASPYYPPDCNGAAGPNHYMQTVNCTYEIYSKTGAVLAGPTNMNLLFGSVTGSSYNDGDPIVLYDEQAQRFFAAEFSISGSNDYMMVAVSATSDPTGTWYKYSFDVADMPDYPKFGVWQDGYYMADNNSSGNDIYVFQRSTMLTGGSSPGMIAFDNPYRPTSIDGFMCVPPVDNDGTFAPTDAPGTFIAFNDDGIGGGSDQLWIYELAANWTTPLSSTFNRVQQLAVSPFDSNFGNDWTNITQPGTTQQLDAIPQVIMNVPQYRNFGTYQTMVCCHTVDVDNTDHAGVRWYELRRGTQTTGNWAIRQQGTYAPDANSRWMGSIMLNGSGKIGLGYSVSSSSVYPSIRYTGQSSAAYNSATGTMDIPEEIIQTGAASQTGVERWGDYSLLSVDPADDQTFWFTSEYISGGSRLTKIASFKFGNSPAVVTLAATAVTGNSATLNGTVNPNTLAITDYHFEWGTTTSYGTNTTPSTIPAGSSAVAVTANLSGLTGGTTYHFRLVATNSDGTSYGSDLSFTPGAASVTTTAASAITLNSASSGGNVTSDGGSAVTARGVCWATTANPTISASHTTDGTGTGTFTSAITGLSSNSLYHVRAYATNGSNTYYGNDLTFTTLCGVVSTFPWTEGFENAGVIPSCWTQEQIAGSGINWTFITGSGNSHPAAAHGGTYNATLIDATSADNKTKLITPTLNLTGITSPVLTFWHTQAFWSPDQDQLVVYYRTSSTGAWTVLATYTASITAWTQETISLPNSSGDYYIAFEGNAKYGYGVCLDDVAINGTPALPTVTTTAASAITTTTATSGGTVTAIGGSAVTARGVCWATTASPTISNSHTTDGSGPGTFVSSITGLTANSPYHIRAYATNTTGTAYGSDLQFTTNVLTLTVTPPNQDVLSTSGNTSFSVTSNSGWTVSSDQPWCTVTPSGSGNGTITATYDANTSASPRVANITVTVMGLTPVVVTVTQAGLPNKTLNLTVLLEGLFNGTTMNQAKNASANQFAGNIADQITVELHNSTTPYDLAGGPYTVNVNTDGTASVTVPASLGATYYIVVKHRNSLETWNGTPISFSGASMSYNFSSSAGQAYGNNLKLVSGKYVIYAGDVNQDGIIDAADLIPVDNDASNFLTGYLTTDVNGDGIVNSGDINMLNNNTSVFVAKITP